MEPSNIPKKGDILFYYVKDQVEDQPLRAKLRVKVLEYPSGDSYRNVLCSVEEVLELNFDEDVIKVGFEDTFDIRDLDSRDIPLEEFVPKSVDELLVLSKEQPEEVPSEPKGEPPNKKKGGSRRKTPRSQKKSKRKTRTKK